MIQDSCSDSDVLIDLTTLVEAFDHQEVRRAFCYSTACRSEGMLTNDAFHEKLHFLFIPDLFSHLCSLTMLSWPVPHSPFGQIYD